MLRSFRRGFRRLPAATFAADFNHHQAGVARLNHGSFGAAPIPVLRAEGDHRATWLANPDALYFDDKGLDSQIADAADAAAAVLNAPIGSVALLENATVCTAIILQRWAEHFRQRGSSSRPGDGVLLLDVCYKAVLYASQAIIEPAGGRTVLSPTPFPGTTHDAVLKSLDATLRAEKPRFALLDHVSSQPALVLPIKEMVALCREHGVAEVAVDAAHAVGMLERADHDVTEIGADFYYCNLHKWAFAPPTVAALHGTAEVLEGTKHIVPSWHVGGGLLRESRWSGTRNYASFQSVPEALDYLEAWRSVDGLTATEYNTQGWREAAARLCDAWQVDLPASSECSAAMGMVPLPRTLDLSNDKPGQPSAGVRATLRDRYQVEAAVGGFGDLGGFLRLSHAVYTTDGDLDRLRDAVLDLTRSSAP
jgi:selenocysteine lyase/cysteine desulfurase